jgi:hypothetical protein
MIGGAEFDFIKAIAIVLCTIAAMHILSGGNDAN